VVTFCPQFARPRKSYAPLGRTGPGPGVMGWLNMKDHLLGLIQKPPTGQGGLSGFSILGIGASYWVLAPHTPLALDGLGLTVAVTGPPGSIIVELIRSGGLIVEYPPMMTGPPAALALIPKIQKGPGPPPWIMLGQRWIRTAPLLPLSYTFYAQVGPFLVRGGAQPWPPLKAQQCHGHWWATILLNGYYTKGGAAGLGNCMIQIWYMPVDFLLYAVSILLIQLYGRNKLWGEMLTSFLLIGSLIYRISSLSLMISPHNPYFNYIVNTPNFAHSCPPGVLWGMLYREYCDAPSRAVGMKKLRAYKSVWLLVGVFMNMIVMFGWDFVTSWLPPPPIWGTLGVNLYVNSMALCLISLSFHEKLCEFLSLRIFHILGKTSYSFYLLNDLGLWTITMVNLLKMNKKEFTFEEVLITILKSLFFTQIASLLWYVLFEKPCMLMNPPSEIFKTWGRRETQGNL